MEPETPYPNERETEVEQREPPLDARGGGVERAVHPEEDHGEVGERVVELGDQGGVGVVELAPGGKGG